MSGMDRDEAEKQAATIDLDDWEWLEGDASRPICEKAARIFAAQILEDGAWIKRDAGSSHIRVEIGPFIGVIDLDAIEDSREVLGGSEWIALEIRDGGSWE